MELKYVLFIGLLLCALVSGENETKRQKKQKKFRSKIVGGTETPITDVPYQVSLHDRGGHFCGGTVISSYWILTAAHCVNDMKSPREFVIVSGASLLDSGFITEVCDFIAHPRYSTKSLRNDIALVKTCTPPPGTRSLSLATYMPPAGSQGMISGWGVTDEDSKTPSEVLQYLWMPIVDHRTCQRVYDQLDFDVEPNTMFCAGFIEGGKDGCQGDSGGPLVTRIGTKKNVLSGIVSFGVGCAREGMLGMYTNVIPYKSWINQYVTL